MKLKYRQKALQIKIYLLKTKTKNLRPTLKFNVLEKIGQTKRDSRLPSDSVGVNTKNKCYAIYRYE